MQSRNGTGCGGRERGHGTWAATVVSPLIVQHTSRRNHSARPDSMPMMPGVARPVILTLKALPHVQPTHTHLRGERGREEGGEGGAILRLQGIP